MVKQQLIESVMEVERVSLRILSMNMLLQGEIVIIISVYEPQSGRNEEEKEKIHMMILPRKFN